MLGVLQILGRARGITAVEVEAEFMDMRLQTELASKTKVPLTKIVQPCYMPHLITSFVIAAGQQLTGINSIMFYISQVTLPNLQPSSMPLMLQFSIGERHAVSLLSLPVPVLDTTVAPDCKSFPSVAYILNTSQSVWPIYLHAGAFMSCDTLA